MGGPMGDPMGGPVGGCALPTGGEPTGDDTEY